MALPNYSINPWYGLAFAVFCLCIRVSWKSPVSQAFLKVSQLTARQLGFLVIYRIFLHPLSKFPGPKLAVLSDLWTVYYSLKGESHLKAYEAHARYGTEVSSVFSRALILLQDPSSGSVLTSSALVLCLLYKASNRENGHKFTYISSHRL